MVNVPTAELASLVSIRLGDKTIPMHHEPACRVCQSSDRYAAEKLIVEGHGYAKILQQLQPDFSERSLRRHVQLQHLPLEKAAHAWAEEKSTEMTAVIEPVARGLSRSLSFAQAVVTRVEERLNDGDIQPSIADALASAKFISEWSEDDATSSDDIIELLFVMRDIAMQIMPTEMFSQFRERLSANREFLDVMQDRVSRELTPLFWPLAFDDL